MDYVQNLYALNERRDLRNTKYAEILLVVVLG